MKIFIRIGAFAAVFSSALLADVTYTESVKYAGGTLVEMMRKMASNPVMGRMGGGAMRNAFQDEDYTVYIKGNKMARVGQRTSTIYDLDAGTITRVNNERQTYTVETFDQMRQQMEQMQQRMNRGQNSDLQFDVKVDKTGQTRNINGQTATDTLLTLTAKGGEAAMVVKENLWLVTGDAATNEVKDFHRKLGEKFSYALGGMSPGFGGASAGLTAAAKEASKLDGYPIETDVNVTGINSPMGGGGNDPNAPALQMETRYSNFMTGAVDDTRFRPPAGYGEEQPRRGRERGPQ